MTNDISRINSSKTQQSDSRQSQRVQDGKSSATSSKSESSSASSADKVSLTSTAARLKDIEQRLSSQSTIDETRINEVKSAISEGKYNVDADSIADKMINFESSLHS